MAKLIFLSRPSLLSASSFASPLPLFGLRSALVPVSYISAGQRTRAIHASSTLSANRNSARRSVAKGSAGATLLRADFDFLLPQTAVFPPLSRYPREPRKILDMLWLQFKNRLQAKYLKIAMQLTSMPKSFRSWPRIWGPFTNVIPEAKAMHIQMCEALASGDKESLRHLCAPALYQTLAGTIDARPNGHYATWELINYVDTWRHPRIADARIMLMTNPQGGDVKLTKQAVVTISSLQRLARYDVRDRGVPIPGSERERQLTEHIVLQSQINPDTYETGPWKLWGHVNETNYDSYVESMQNMEVLSKKNAGFDKA